MLQQVQVFALRSPSEEEQRAWPALQVENANSTVSFATNVLPRDEDDLAMLAPDPPRSRLNTRITDFLVNTLFGIAARPVPGKEIGGLKIIDYSANNVIAAVDIITATSASVTLMLSIVILYFVHSSGIRLAIIGVFTLCSSGGFALLTTATSTEIFSFTAA